MTEHMLHAVLTVAALAALFLPLFGPLLDHHFAERQPAHAHIYLEGTDLEHLHSYETNNHYQLHARSNVYDDDRAPAGILFLSDTNGAGSGSSGAMAYLQQKSQLVFDPEGEPDRFALSPDDSFITDATMPNPKKPPRA